MDFHDFELKSWRVGLLLEGTQPGQRVGPPNPCGDSKENSWISHAIYAILHTSNMLQLSY